MIKSKISIGKGEDSVTLSVLKEYNFRGERKYIVLNETTGNAFPTPADPFDALYKGPGGKISKHSKGKPITKKHFKANEMAHAHR